MLSSITRKNVANNKAEMKYCKVPFTLYFVLACVLRSRELDIIQ